MFEQFDAQKSATHTIIPIPYEGVLSFGQGCKDGGFAIIEAANHLELYNMQTATRPVDKRIELHYPIEGQDAELMVDEVKQRTLEVMQHGRIPIILGGDHSTPIGAVKAIQEKYQNVTVLQFDAHPDLFYSWNNDTHNHRTFGWHASQGSQLIQYGIRAVDEDELNYAQENNILQLGPHEEDTSKIIENTSEHVYISIDVDVFDPSIITGTGTPEPDGITYRKILDIIKEVATQRTIVGFDIVEYAPREDEAAKRAESYTLAKLLYTIIGLTQK